MLFLKTSELVLIQLISGLHFCGPGLEGCVVSPEALLLSQGKGQVPAAETSHVHFFTLVLAFGWGQTAKWWELWAV